MTNIQTLPAALPSARYMVQVWEYGRWCDYWPTENRRNARGVLKPFWRSKRWRVVDRGGKS